MSGIKNVDVLLKSMKPEHIKGKFVFCSIITKKLAEEGISVNAISAYYHDHLFVPYEKVEQAMKALKEISS